MASDRKITITISARDEFGSIFSRYQEALGKADQQTKKAAQSTNYMGDAVRGMVAGLSIGKMIEWTKQVYEQGAEAEVSENRFRALTETMGGYEEAMAAMRRATLGSVDDMHLQQSAMMLIQTAGVETSAELERMAAMVLRLKSPAEDAATAFKSFGLALANQSLLRLDQLGISAANVRNEMTRLLESGEALNRSQAFRFAVMSEGEKMVARLGDSADDASTSLDRFGVSITNVYQDAAQAFASGTQNIGSLVERALGIAPEQQAEAKQNAEDAAESMANDFLSSWQNVYDQAMSAGYDDQSNFIGQFIARSLEAAAADPNLAADASALANKVISDMVVSGDLGLLDSIGMYGSFGLVKQEYADIAEAAAQDLLTRREIREQTEATADAMALQAERTEQWNQQLTKAADQNAMIANLYRDAVNLSNQASGMVSGMDALAGQGISTRGGSGNPDYLTSGQAEELRGIANAAQDLYDQMKALEETNNAAFSDDDLERAKQQVDYLDAIADSGEKAAEAYREMSLAQGLGRQDGGMLGDITDTLMDDLQRLDATQQMMDDIQRKFDLASGRETAVGAVWEDRISDVVAGIAQNISSDKAVAIAEDWASLIQEATLRGIDMNSPEMATELEGIFANLNFDPAEFDPSGFLDKWDPAAQAATTINEQGSAFADSSITSADSFDRMAVSSDTIKANFEAISNKVHKVQIQPEFVNVPALFQLLIPSFMQWVQSAGGAVPGTSLRSSESGPIDRRR